MLPAMTRTLRLASMVMLLSVVTPGSVAAHEGAEPWIHVPAQSIEPGQPFELWGADLGSGGPVTVDIAAGDQSIRVGQVTADADGHFTQSLTLPGHVSEGYAQMTARSDSGDVAYMWVLVGQNTTGAVSPAAAADNQWWSDPSVLVLGGMLGAALVAVVVLAFRAGRRTAPTAAPAHAGPLPRKGSRKARRRTG
jgi:hypothetical protein